MQIDTIVRETAAFPMAIVLEAKVAPMENCSGGHVLCALLSDGSCHLILWVRELEADSLLGLSFGELLQATGSI